MKIKNIPLLLAIILLAGLGSVALAQESAVKNVGFPSRNVWFSKEGFLAGEEVSINTLVLNDAAGTFSGVMEFYDRKELLGKTAFSITATQKVKIVSFSWTATPGEHDISAKMTETVLTTTKGEKAPVVVPQTTTGEITVTVLQDVNKNSIADVQELVSTTSIQYPDKKVFGEGAEMVKGAIPEPVKTATKSLTETLDAFRVKEKEVVSEAKVNNIAQIEDLNRREVEAKITANNTASSTATTTFGVMDHVERPLRYLYWAALVVFAEILDRSWLFYIIVIGLAYYIVRAIWRKVRGR